MEVRLQLDMDLTRRFPTQDWLGDTIDPQPLFDVNRSPMSDTLDLETIPNTDLSSSPPCQDMSDVVCSSSGHLPTSDDSSNNLTQDEGTYEVKPNVLPSTYQLPSRTTHGKPKVQYEPDMHAKTKYQINNYLSTHHFPSHMHHIYVIFLVISSNKIARCLI